MEKRIDYTCPNCGTIRNIRLAYLTRANKIGSPLYCTRACAGLARRSNKTKEEKVREKAEYDKQYRYYHKEGIKQKKAAAFKKDYAENPEKYKAVRQARYPEHLKYLQSAEYKEWKRKYDESYHAKRRYGDFAESFIILKEIIKINDYTKEQQFQDGLLSRTTKSKRQWKNLQQTTSKQRFGRL